MSYKDISTDATGLTPLPLPYPKLAPHALDLFSLKGKVAAISGSSTGIGWEVAKAYAQAGADVAVWYNSHNPEEKVQQLIKETGRKIKCYRVPVTDPDAVEKTIDQIVDDFGKLDIFVANAGVPWTSGALIDNPGHKDWFKVVDLDFNGAMFCAKAAGKHFKKQGFGSMIFTASMSGHIVNIPQLQACYNAAKAGILHFSRSLAVEWAGFARSNTVSPGYVSTEISDFVPADTKKKWLQLIPVGRECDPRELVGAYIYLASDASTYTTGADIRVDGAYACP